PVGPPRALIFDSEFDQYRGVIAYIRVVDGAFRKGAAIRAMAAGTQAEIDDIGVFSPQMMPTDQLAAGEVGYLITGLKDVTQLRVGDTLTVSARGGGASRAPGVREASEPLPGYREVKPMVYDRDVAKRQAEGPQREHVRERSEEHTSELQSPDHLVCRLLLEKKKYVAKLRAR